MNTFALEIFDNQGQVCTFYTVRWEDATLSETDKFFQKFRYNEQLKNSLRELASFIEVVIGDEHGALEYFFRFENAAQALPLRVLTKCKIYLSNMEISPSDCIAYGFQKNWW